MASILRRIFFTKKMGHKFAKFSSIKKTFLIPLENLITELQLKFELNRLKIEVGRNHRNSGFEKNAFEVLSVKTFRKLIV